MHQNPVKHGLVRGATEYRWCSAAWFEHSASRAQVKTIYIFKIDRVKVDDDYEPVLLARWICSWGLRGRLTGCATGGARRHGVRAEHSAIARVAAFPAPLSGGRPPQRTRASSGLVASSESPGEAILLRIDRLPGFG